MFRGGTTREISCQEITYCILSFSSKWIWIQIAASSLMDGDELFQPANNSIRIHCQHFHLALNQVLCRYYLEGQKQGDIGHWLDHKFINLLTLNWTSLTQFRVVIFIFQHTRNGKCSNNSKGEGWRLSSFHNGVNNFNYLVSLHYLFIYSCVRCLYLIITLC